MHPEGAVSFGLHELVQPYTNGIPQEVDIGRTVPLRGKFARSVKRLSLYLFCQIFVNECIHRMDST